MSSRTVVRCLAGTAILLSAVSAAGFTHDIWIRPTGEDFGDRHGTCISRGDLDADGFSDVIVGAHLADANGFDSGRVWVYFGGVTPDATPGLVLTGETFINHFGVSTDVGDVNGDGFDDLLVGAQENDAGGTNAGRAYVFFGGPLLDAVADVVYTGPAAGDWLGVSVALGDVNGDGFDDAILGCRMQGAHPGKVLVCYGGTAPDNVADIVFTGTGSGDRFGRSLACAGDWNGDGYDDIQIGAPYNDTTGPDAGSIAVFLGGATPDVVPDLQIFGSPGMRLGAAVMRTPGDWNGDGYDDVVVGRYTEPGGGLVEVYLGGATPDDIPDAVLHGTDPQLRLGHFASYAGDLDLDGVDDLIVGATPAVEYSPGPGKAYVYFGGAGCDPNPDVVFAGEGYEGFGVAATGVGDVNGDGFPDVAVGAIWWEQNTGRTHVFACHPAVVAGLDIKPGACPNPLNSRNRGRLQVAVLGDEDFDVCDIDVSTVRLEGVPAIRHRVRDVSRPVPDGSEECACTTTGPDGLPDLLLTFQNQEIVAALRPLTNGEERVLTLTAQLIDGTAVTARDCVRVNVPGHGHDHAMLLGNAPNPFNPATVIAFELAGIAGVDLRIHDVSGRLVRVLLAGEEMAPGRHEVVWDGRDSGGRRAASGVYFCRMVTTEGSETQRMVMMK